MPRGTRKYIVDLQQIREALVQSGYTKLDQQAKALGVHRSTAWTIIKTRHKLGRLSAKTTQRILANPDTPPSVRSAFKNIWPKEAMLVCASCVIQGSRGHLVPCASTPDAIGVKTAYIQAHNVARGSWGRVGVWPPNANDENSLI